MSVFKRIQSGETTNKDLGWVYWFIGLGILAGIFIGMFMVG